MAAAVNGAPMPSQPSERTDADAIRALVDVIKKEEITVVVNLDAKIQVRLGSKPCIATTIKVSLRVSGDDAARFAQQLLPRSRAFKQTGFGTCQRDKSQGGKAVSVRQCWRLFGTHLDGGLTIAPC